MITQQAQIKINISAQLKDFVESRAKKFGMPTAAYIKHLIMNDIAETQYPSFQASERTEKKALKAIKKIDQATSVNDVSAYFKNLK
jgi:antitoxin component of RelBE/YafQ-DinJ toxin-antitoxin module